MDLMLCISPDKIIESDYIGELYGLSEEELQQFKDALEIYNQPEDFLSSKLAKILQEFSNDKEISIYVNLFNDADYLMRFFEFIPNKN